jgi:hypothetical protein
LTTVKAASADGGKFDAALVRVFSAVVSDTARLATGDYRFRLDDGSGAVEVILDRDSGFQFSPFIPGVRVDVAGVLVPIASSASWRLKPRAQSDIVIK